MIDEQPQYRVSDEWVEAKIRALRHFPQGDDYTPWRVTLDAVLDLRDSRKRIAELEAAIKARVEALAPWRCFHCGFETSDPKDAEAHFGERDDAEEFTPICKWGTDTEKSEILQTLQDTCKDLNQERDDNATLLHKNEGLQYRLDSYADEIEKLFKGCRTITEAWQQLDSMEGRALVAEEQLDKANRTIEAVRAALKAGVEAMRKALSETEAIQNIDEEGCDGDIVADAMFELSKDVIKTLTSALAKMKAVIL